MKNEAINKNDTLSKITPVIEQAANQLELIPVEISFIKEAGRWHLKIFIYNPQRPISHKDCEDLTRNIDEYLDQLISVPYYLEVSSPGTERKLKSEREYNIFSGKKVEIKLKQPLEEKGSKVIEAKLLDYNPEKGLIVQVEDSVITLDQKNISSVKLKAEYKYRGESKSD